MRDRRFDHRSKNTFKKDIAFGTAVEKYFWNGFLTQLDLYGIKYTNADNNGVDNDGGYIETGNKTAGADYRITVANRDLPLEVKWVPTPGKLTLKKGDLIGYKREGAAILFIINMKGPSLRKPRDYDLEAHLAKIEQKKRDIMWGVMMPEKVDALLHMCDTYSGKLCWESISYMGGKTGVVIPEKDFVDWFKLRKWL